MDEKQLKCIMCGAIMPSVYSYHKHNVRQHSVVQLSRAILKLQHLQVPLNDPTSDGDDEDDYEEERKRLELDMADVLDIPIKCELMDEEVIELGPTENADDLEVQSRLVKNPNDDKQHSRQIIEVQENQPPPCYINPAVEDPDAIVVKFNRELVMALDNAQTTINSSFPEKRIINRSLRAVCKSSIEIPDPNAFARDYRQSGSRSYDKYVMQNVILMENSPKRRRGRPRKVALPHLSRVKQKASGEDGLSETADEDDIADPPLLSDNEEEESTASLASITRSRSGRLIKTRKKDGAFRYYDMPGQELLDHDDLNNQQEWKDDAIQDRLRRRHRKKRKLDYDKFQEDNRKFGCDNRSGKENQKFGCDDRLSEDSRRYTCDDRLGEEDWSLNHNNRPGNERSIDIGYSSSEILGERETCNKSDTKSDSVEVEDSRAEEGMSMPLIEHHVEDENCSIKVESTKSVEAPTDNFECLMCFKSFTAKEDWEKHSQEHLTDVAKSTDILSADSDNVPEAILHSDCLGEDLVKDEFPNNANAMASNNESSVEEELNTPTKSAIPPSKTDSPHYCSICNVTFKSEEEFGTHTHDSFHECHICFKKYQGRLNLQAHIKKYHEETEWMKYKCTTCGKSFGFLMALERHMKEHNPNQKFCCDQCGKVFKNLANLKSHVPLHTKSEVFTCPYCPKQYYIKYSYEKHVRMHERPKYHCEVCDGKFIEKKQFELHLQRHQSSGSHGRSRDFKCNNCGDIKTQSDLDIVGTTDVGHHKTCIACGKGLYKKYRYIVDSHYITPLPMKDERQREQCKFCGKYVLNLPRHIRNTHLGNEYVSCDLCGLVVTKGSLPSHKNRKHGGSKVTCDHCNQTFKNIMCLREHMAKVRRKEDPSRNVCKFCKEVVSADNWKEHMAKHKSKCSDCGAAHFATHEEFLAHLDSCRRCSNCNLSTFVSREEFLSHIEICSSGIDVITSSLDSTSEQEVVTSIFAIVDGNMCEICGSISSDPECLARHIADVHPEALPADHVFGDGGMISEAILYACPRDSCGAIVTSKDLLKNHMSAVHDVVDVDKDSGIADDSQELELGSRRYLYAPTGFKSLM